MAKKNAQASSIVERVTDCIDKITTIDDEMKDSFGDDYIKQAIKSPEKILNYIPKIISISVEKKSDRKK